MPSLYQAQFRHARHYETQLKTAHDLSAQGHEGVRQGLQLFEQEQEHILTALAWSGGQAAVNDEAAKLCHGLLSAGDSFLMLRQHPLERIRWTEMGLVAARRLKQPAFEGFYLNQLASMHFTLGDYDQWSACSEKALSAGFELQGLDEALQLCTFADPYVQVGEVLLVTDHTDALYRLFDLLHQKMGIAGARLQYADDEAAADVARQAINLAAASAERFIQSGDKSGEAKALANLASSQATLGEYQHAIETYQRALALHRDLGDQRGGAAIQGVLGWLFAALGEMTKSLELLTEALDTLRKIKDSRGEYLTLGSLAVVHAIRGEQDQALIFFRQTLELARARKDINAENLILSNISLIE